MEVIGSEKDIEEQNTTALNAICRSSDSSRTIQQVRARDEQVRRVRVRGVDIFALRMGDEVRLCLAQLSALLLADFTYNEIHNRRVALGISCAQCTPLQLEQLRRAGAMPLTSRRCGMITQREAERLVRSFLDAPRPPRLSHDFRFRVEHSCGWGCRGSFMPSRYTSSRAKCVQCDTCKVFLSPNKFIFHSHASTTTTYRHPDAANFTSWRRHLHLRDGSDAHLLHAWEDVKAVFNGGSKRRLQLPTSTSVASRPQLSSVDRCACAPVTAQVVRPLPIRLLPLQSPLWFPHLPDSSLQRAKQRQMTSQDPDFQSFSGHNTTSTSIFRPYALS